MKKNITNIIFALASLLLYPCVQLTNLYFVSEHHIKVLSFAPSSIDYHINEILNRKIYCTDYSHRYKGRNNKSLEEDALFGQELGLKVSGLFSNSRRYIFDWGTSKFAIYMINKCDIPLTKNFKILKELFNNYEQDLKREKSFDQIFIELCPNGEQTDELVSQERKEEIFKDIFAVMREYQPKIQKHVDLQLAQQWKIKYLAYFLIVFETIGMIIVFHKFYIHVLGRLLRGEKIRWKDDL